MSAALSRRVPAVGHRWRFAVLVVVAVAPVIGGWYLVLSSRVVTTVSTPGLLTAVHASITLPALVAEWRRPGNATSWLLVVASAAMVVAPLRVLERRWPAVLGTGALLALSLVPFHALLALADEHTVRRWRGGAVVVMWIVPSVLAVGMIVLSGPRHTETGLDDGGRRAASWAYLHPGGENPDTWFRQGNPLQRGRADGLLVGLWIVWAALAIATAIVTTVAVGQSLRRARPVERRGARFVLLSTVAAALATAGVVLAAFPERITSPVDVRAFGSVYADRSYAEAVLAAPGLAAVVLGATLVWGELVRPRLARYASGSVRFDATAATDAGRLRRVLGDSSARVLFHTDGGGWIDEVGSAVSLAGAPGRAATVVTRGGVPVAAVEYDESLHAQADLVDVAVTSLGLSLESRRLAAVDRAATDDIQSSALRLLGAARQARATVEDRIAAGPGRTLDDLVGLLDRRPVPYDAVHDGLRRAVAEVREIAHGIAPAGVVSDGLAVALDDLAAMADLPVVVEFDTAAADALPSALAVTVYAVVQHAVRTATSALTVAMQREVAVEGASWVVRLHGTVAPLGQLVVDRIRTLGGASAHAGDHLTVELPLAGDMNEESA